ncbi:uncharacterized, partial [Lates japonicus]
MLFCRARVRLDAEYTCGAKVYWFSCCSLDRNTSSHLTNQTVGSRRTSFSTEIMRQDSAPAAVMERTQG